MVTIIMQFTVWNSHVSKTTMLHTIIWLLCVFWPNLLLTRTFLLCVPCHLSLPFPRLRKLNFIETNWGQCLLQGEKINLQSDGVAVMSDYVRNVFHCLTHLQTSELELRFIPSQCQYCQKFNFTENVNRIEFKCWIKNTDLLLLLHTGFCKNERKESAEDVSLK